MNAKDLNLVRDLRADIWNYEKALKNLRQMVSAKIPSYDGMPKGSSVSSAVERIGVRIADLSNKIEMLKHTLEDAAASLEKKIFDEVKDAKLQTILILRYVDGMTFGYIGQVMGYSEKHIRRLHGAILNRLKKCDKMSADVR